MISFSYLPRLEHHVSMYMQILFELLTKLLTLLRKHQANNAYIFPGFGLGVVISGAIRVKDDMVLAAGNSTRTRILSYKFDVVCYSIELL